MELLRDQRSALSIPRSELLKVLLGKRGADILGTHVGGVARPRHLDDREDAPGRLLLHPEDVDLYVANFVEARPLCHADRCTGVHADSDPGIGNPEVAEESDHAEALSGGANCGIKL